MKIKIYEHRKLIRDQNKEAYNAKQKEYQQLNKDIINERKREKITCICGCIFSKNGKSKHEKTKLHLEFITNH